MNESLKKNDTSGDTLVHYSCMQSTSLGLGTPRPLVDAQKKYKVKHLSSSPRISSVSFINTAHDLGSVDKQTVQQRTILTADYYHQMCSV